MLDLFWTLWTQSCSLSSGTNSNTNIVNVTWRRPLWHSPSPAGNHTDWSFLSLFVFRMKRGFVISHRPRLQEQQTPMRGKYPSCVTQHFFPPQGIFNCPTCYWAGRAPPLAGKWANAPLLYIFPSGPRAASGGRHRAEGGEKCFPCRCRSVCSREKPSHCP